MTFFLNAWLERENPILELRESITNRMVYHIEGDVLNDWLNKGELCVNDLNSIEETSEVIRDLLLKSITEDVSTKQKCDFPINNVIKFPRRFRRPSKGNSSSRKSNNVIYLYSLLSKRVLKYLDNAIY